LSDYPGCPGKEATKQVSVWLCILCTKSEVSSFTPYSEKTGVSNLTKVSHIADDVVVTLNCLVYEDVSKFTKWGVCCNLCQLSKTAWQQTHSIIFTSLSASSREQLTGVITGTNRRTSYSKAVHVVFAMVINFPILMRNHVTAIHKSVNNRKQSLKFNKGVT